MKRRKTETILVVDDQPLNLDVLTQTLEPAGYQVLAVPNGEIALQVAQRAQPDLILLDVVMPEYNGFDVCQMLKKNPLTRDIPVLFVSARHETSTLVKGFEAGGIDYIAKPFQSAEVLVRIDTHLKNRRLTAMLQEKNQLLQKQATALQEANEKLQSEMLRRNQAEAKLDMVDQQRDALEAHEAAKWSMSKVVGESPTMNRILKEAEQLKSFGSTSVLISGESGTGKEMLARAIHSFSQTDKAPFIPVNCMALSPEAAESTFFGHVAGAFPGALTDRKGCFELADQGTLFLDEIADMPQAIQARLLRVLEDGVVHPIGSNEPRQVKCRIIATTNVDIQSRISAGTFRQDLYFRLARFTLSLPPLRERPEDIPLLASHFIQHFVNEMGVAEPVMDTDAMAQLCNYSFPGNVRELKNIIERALISSSGNSLSKEHLHLPVYNDALQHGTATMQHEIARLPLKLEDAETELIKRALQQTKGNIAQAARLLGIHRTRIYRMMASGTM